MTRLSSGLPTGARVDAIMGVLTGSSMFRVLGSYRVLGLSTDSLSSSTYRVLGLSTDSLGSSTYRVLGVTGFSGLSGFWVAAVTGITAGFVGSFVTGIMGASNDAIGVFMGVLSRGAWTSRDTQVYWQSEFG